MTCIKSKIKGGYFKLLIGNRLGTSFPKSILPSTNHPSLLYVNRSFQSYYLVNVATYDKELLKFEVFSSFELPKNCETYKEHTKKRGRVVRRLTRIAIKEFNKNYDVKKFRSVTINHDSYINVSVAIQTDIQENSSSWETIIIGDRNQTFNNEIDIFLSNETELVLGDIYDLDEEVE